MTTPPRALRWTTDSRPGWTLTPRTGTARASTLRRDTLKRASALLMALTMVVVSQSTTADAAPVMNRAEAFDADGVAAGSVGPQVTRLQQALMEGGVFLPGGADGVFGAATTKAIGDFQTWNGLTRTGALNTATVRLLGLGSESAGGSVSAVSDGSAASSDGSSTYANLSVGSQGAAVVDVQRALMATGLVIRGGDDGVFGGATERALKAFQRVNGMVETGRMSERTERLLDPASATAPTSESAAMSQAAAGSQADSGGWTHLERFPVQGNCAYGDTWHAPRGNGRVHEGVDIIAATGRLLYAVADGTITTQYWDYPGRLSGNGLKLTAADGTYFLYLHMSAFAPGIARGTQVKAGDVIGFVGNTGSSATPHLHFEIHPGGGGAVNPYPYVRAIDDCSNTRAQYQSSFS